MLKGNVVDLVKLGMPADFPRDREILVTFKKLGGCKMKMIVKEYADFGQMFDFVEIGLKQ